jgi:hypothetical protein
MEGLIGPEGGIAGLLAALLIATIKYLEQRHRVGLRAENDRLEADNADLRVKLREAEQRAEKAEERAASDNEDNGDD